MTNPIRPGRVLRLALGGTLVCLLAACNTPMLDAASSGDTPQTAPASSARIAVDVGVIVTDMERSLGFYRDLLALPVVAEVTTSLIGKGRMVQLRHGASLIKLVEMDAAPSGGRKTMPVAKGRDGRYIETPSLTRLPTIVMPHHFASRLRLLVLIACIALLPLGSLSAQDFTKQLALQTWTMRNMDFEAMVDFAVEMDIPYLQMWSSRSGGHMDPSASWDEIKRQKEILDRHGLTVYSFGVTRLTKNEEELREAFEFAKLMGVEVITAEPSAYRQLDLLEAFAIVYDIKVALHNHDIHSPYGNPYVVRQLLEDRDPRLGVCLDVGWMTTTRLDVEQVYREYGDWVLDIHLKDKTVTPGDEGDQYTDVDIGTGDANLIGLFNALRETGYAGRIAIETDQNLQDPTAFVQGAIAFVKAQSR